MDKHICTKFGRKRHRGNTEVSHDQTYSRRLIRVKSSNEKWHRRRRRQRPTIAAAGRWPCSNWSLLQRQRQRHVSQCTHLWVESSQRRARLPLIAVYCRSPSWLAGAIASSRLILHRKSSVDIDRHAASTQHTNQLTQIGTVHSGEWVRSVAWPTPHLLTTCIVILCMTYPDSRQTGHHSFPRTTARSLI